MASSSGSTSGSGGGGSNYIPEASGSSSSFNKLESIPSSRLNNNDLLLPSTTTTSSTKTRRTSTTSRHKLLNSTFERECEAIDRFEDECNNLVSHGSSSGKGKGKAIISNGTSSDNIWCNLHVKEERVLREEFESLTREIKALPLPLYIPTNKINSTEDLKELELLEVSIRIKFTLVEDSIKIYNYHLSHFNSSTHSLAGELTLEELHNLEKSLSSNLNKIILKSHKLILISEDALWLNSTSTTNVEQHQPTCHASSTSTASTSTRPPFAPLLQSEEEEPNPVVALETMKRSEILEVLSLAGSHATFISDSRKSIERVRIIESLFRRLISKDPELLVKAFSSTSTTLSSNPILNTTPQHDHILRFLEDPSCCSLSSLICLYKAFQNTSIFNIKEAIQDTFRSIEWERNSTNNEIDDETEEGEEGEGIQLLGGWTYKLGNLGKEMGSREWGHVYDLCSCPGCALRLCTTFSEWTYIRRLTIISNGANPPPFLQWGNSKESDASKIFKSLNLIKTSEDRLGIDLEIRKVNGGFIGSRGKGIFVERLERNWLVLKMSTTHPHAIPILSALYNSHVVIVKTHSTPTKPHPLFPIPPPSHLWYSRHRSAPSKSDLKHLSYSIDPDGFGLANNDTELILNSLEKLDSILPTSLLLPTSSKFLLKDTYEVLILDGYGKKGEGDGFSYTNHFMRTFESFENEISQLVLVNGVGIPDLKTLLELTEEECRKRGDFGDVGGGEAEGGGVAREIEKAVRALEDVDVSSLVPGVKKVELSSDVGNGGRVGKQKKKAVESSGMEGLRNDALAFKLSRSLFN